MEGDRVSVMLITSRETHRWVVPKGHPMRGMEPHEAAAQEAWEEAGLRGFPCAVPIGRYRYVKRRRVRGDRPGRARLCPLPGAAARPAAGGRAARSVAKEDGIRPASETCF